MKTRFSMTFAAAATVAAASMLAISCVPQEPAADPAPSPQPPVTPAPAPAPAAQQDKWTEWDITPGDWAYRSDSRGSIALFGPAGGEAIVTLRCDTARQRIYLTRRSNQRSGNFTIRTSAKLKTAGAVTTAGTPPYLAIEMMPRDPILDAISYSRGRFAIEATGERGLAIPVYPEISRVIEDCR